MVKVAKSIQITNKIRVSEPTFLWIVLLLFIFSRALTSIFYIEDVDSLRFALAIKEFDLNKFQPHFPAYPVFCFITKIFYWLTGNLGLSFSIVGGGATFLLFFSGYKLLKKLNVQSSDLILLLVVFFNPLLWIMGNRYMPDLLGLGLTALIFLFFFEAKAKERQSSLVYFYFFLAMLAGIRISYIPIFIVPSMILFFGQYKKIPLQVTAFSIGMLSWVVPVIIDTGWSNLVDLAIGHLDGHFNEWGGTITTESSYASRFIMMALYTWADGLGGYLPGRSWVSLPVSLLLISGISLGIYRFLKKPKSNSLTDPIYIILFSMLVYLVWIFLYQNVMYKSRHLMPLVFYLLIVITVGLTVLVKKIKWSWAVIGLAIVFNAILTSKLVYMHKTIPSAIAQATVFLKQVPGEQNIIIGHPLINHYLQSQQIPDSFELKNIEDISVEQVNAWSERRKVYSFFKIEQGGVTPKQHVFYHNPYVNRMWNIVTVYEY